MAEYDHLPLRRVGETQDRRRTQAFGTPPERDRPTHAVKIIAEANAIVEAAGGEPEIEGIDPSLILKAVVPGFTSEDDWRRAGLTLIGHDEGEVLILFSDDLELSEFRRRTLAYSEGPAAEQRSAPYAGFIEAIDSLSTLTPSDRIGVVLREEGLTRLELFDPESDYILDVELWRPTNEFVDVYVRRAALVINNSDGEILSEYRGTSGILLRVRGSGALFKDLLKLKEVAAIDRPPQPDFETSLDINITRRQAGRIFGPAADAICIGIVDSGVNSGHPMLADVVVGEFGLSGYGSNDEKGHGTQVAGIAAYGNIAARLAQQEFRPRFKIASARVVDQNGCFADEDLPHQLMREAITKLHEEFGCKIINVSLCDPKRVTSIRASLWAETLDELARELDLVLVVSVGNSNRSRLVATYGDQIPAQFPDYLLEPFNRVLDPAGAINIVTVGSISHSNGLQVGDGIEILPISASEQPSPFTRSGKGVAGAFKPDFLDYGGTAIFDGLTQNLQDGSTRQAAGITTLHHDYLNRLFSTASGTSFAAPLVAYKAASILEQFPDSSANFVRTLLALSAEVPVPCSTILTTKSESEKHTVVGHGLCDLETAVFSDDNRVVLTAEDSLEPDKFAVFEIPIPDEFHSTPGRRSIDVSLAFDPPVRRNRLDYAGIRMQFDVVRGATEQEVVDAFRSLRPDEDDVRLENTQKCTLLPRVNVRKTGTLQSAKFSMVQNVAHYGDTYYLVVRCIGRWARDVIDAQNFAVAVMMRHAAEIPLYARVQQRIRLALRA